MIIIQAFLSKTCLTRLLLPNRDIHEDTVETILCSLNVKLASSVTPSKVSSNFNRFQFHHQNREAKVIYLGGQLSAFKKRPGFVFSGLLKSLLLKQQSHNRTKTRTLTRASKPRESFITLKDHKPDFINTPFITIKVN